MNRGEAFHEKTTISSVYFICRHFRYICRRSKRRYGNTHVLPDLIVARNIQYKTEIVEELEQLFELFQQNNPNVRIELETPSDFATVLKSRINAKNIPDIYNVKEAGWKLERFMEHDMILDLTDQPFIGRITDSAMPAVTHNGRVWALPMDLGAQGIIYNKELFRKAGIASPPATVSELKEAVIKLKKIDVIPFGVAFKDAWTLRQMYAQGHHATTDPIAFVQNMNAGTASFWNPQMNQVFDVFDLIAANCNDNPFDSNATNQYALFAQGKVGMIVQGLWAMQPVLQINPDIEAGMFGFPVYEDPKKQRMMVDADYKLAINPDSEGVEKALEFFDFLTSAKATDIWIREAHLISSVKGTSVEAMELEPALDIKRYVDDGKTYAWGYAYWPTGMTSELEKMMQLYYLGELNRREFSNEMDRTWRELSK